MKNRPFLYFGIVIAIGAICALSVVTSPRKSASITTAPSDVGIWKIVSPDNDKPFDEVYFLDENQGWGAIKNSGLWKTVDGGRHWIEIWKVPQNGGYSRPISHIYFPNQNEGWFIEDGSLFHSLDGGASWQKQDFDRGVIIRSFRFLDSNDAWLAGEQIVHPDQEGEVERWHGVLYVTKDGGKAWHEKLTGLPMTKNTYANWRLFDVWPISPQEVWAVGDQTVLHSIDGGRRWDEIAIQNKEGVYGYNVKIAFADSDTGWITTNQPGGYLFTNNGGKTWQPRQPPAGTESLDALVYINSSEVWAVAKNIYRSDDGGASWIQVHEGDYWAIQYLRDKNTLVATGKHLAKYKRP